MNFLSLDYLQDGNPRQQTAYHILTTHKVWDKLRQYHPILAGTIPIGIDIASSDLDILCQVEDHNSFRQKLIHLFGEKPQFAIEESTHNGLPTTIARFTIPPFSLEIFGQNIPTHRQNAYRHLLVEHRILMERGEEFRRQVIELKEQGLKTEPAFALLLGLSGDPYETLLLL